MAQASNQRKRPGNPPRRTGQGKAQNRARRPVNRNRKPSAQGSGGGRATQSKASSGSSSKNSLAKLLSPENIQDTVKSVGSLRTQVKRWMGYLQQADQVLDTVFFTTNSLKDTGVLDKIVKQRGKNLSTEDFTNILVALMNSPAGSQIFKSLGGGSDDDSSEAEAEVVEAPPANQELVQGQPAAARRRAPAGGKRPQRRTR